MACNIEGFQGGVWSTTEAIVSIQTPIMIIQEPAIWSFTSFHSQVHLGSLALALVQFQGKEGAKANLFQLNASIPMRPAGRCRWLNNYIITIIIQYDSYNMMIYDAYLKWVWSPLVLWPTMVNLCEASRDFRLNVIWCDSFHSTQR